MASNRRLWSLMMLAAIVGACVLGSAVPPPPEDALIESTSAIQQADDGQVWNAASDGTFIYFASYSATLATRVTKVRLSNLTRAGNTTLEPNEYGGRGMAVADGIAYVSLLVRPGRIVAIATNNMSRVGNLTLLANENNTRAMLVAGPFLYATATGLGAPIIVQIRRSNFTRVGTLSLTGLASYVTSITLDPQGEFLFGCNYVAPISCAKVRLGDLALVAVRALDPSFTNLNAVTHDGTHLLAGATSPSGPVVIIKLLASNLSVIANLTLESYEIGIGSLVMDQDLGHAHAILNTDPQRATKIRLGSAMVRVGSNEASGNRNGCHDGCALAAGGDVYSLTGAAQPYVLRWTGLSVTTTTAVPTDALLRANGSELTAFDGLVQNAATDGTYAYLPGFGNYRARLTKVRLADMQRVANLSLAGGPSNETHASSVIVLDGAAYVTCRTSPVLILKINTTTMERIATLAFDAGEDNGYVSFTDGTFLYTTALT